MFWFRFNFFLTEASNKFDLWPSILELKGNTMLFEPKKQFSLHYFYPVLHSSCGGEIKEKVCIGHHHYLSAHNKIPDALAISMVDLIYPVLRSHVFMANNPVAFIT